MDISDTVSAVALLVAGYSKERVVTSLEGVSLSEVEEVQKEMRDVENSWGIFLKEDRERD